MFRFVVVLLGVLVCHGVTATSIGGIVPLSDSIVPLLDGRIVGGVDADIRDFPHQISIRNYGNHRCGGSIYSANIVVSAAHCVNGVNPRGLSIAAGSTLLSDKQQEVPVAQYIIHSEYDYIDQDNDVAILILSGKLEFNENVQPIALATERPAVGSVVTVTGWGKLSEVAGIPDHLQRVDVETIDDSVCKEIYKDLLTSRMLCAGVVGGGKDACQGDSGGPLVYNNQLLGVVSWGIGCGRKNYPGVYASVPVLHDWIVKTAGGH